MDLSPAKTEKKARPQRSARLLLMLCVLVGMGIVGGEGTEYLMSLSRDRYAFTTDAPVRLATDASDPASFKMDLNAATVQDLQQVPGIGPALAQTLVDYREQIGGFFFVEEALDVPGIGEKRLQAIREWFCLPSAPMGQD